MPSTREENKAGGRVGEPPEGYLNYHSLQCFVHLSVFFYRLLVTINTPRPDSSIRAPGRGGPVLGPLLYP